MNRRSFLRLSSGAAGLAIASPLIAACGNSSSSKASGSSTELEKLTYQLSWVKNFQFAGEYIADSKGYYKANGLQVTLLSGGPNVGVDAVVQAGKALVGQSSPDFTANAIARGADIKIIGANYQKSPFCIMSLGKKPINEPADLIGKKIGIQSTNEVAWGAFLKLAKIDPSKINKVPVQFDVAPLASGQVDGFWGYSNDDVIHLQEKGIDVKAMLLADHGYKLPTATYSVRADSLTDKDKRAQIVSFLKADIKGWQDAVTDPALSAKLTVDVYGKGQNLDLKTQQLSAAATNQLMVTADTKAHGLMWMTPALTASAIGTLAAAGIKADESMFTNEILQEVYQGGTTVA